MTLSISPNNQQVLVTNAFSYTVTDDFAVDGTFPIAPKQVKSLRAQASDILLWGSWTGDDAHTGKLISPAFSAPRILSLFVAGYPNAPNNQLMLRQVDTGIEIPFVLSDPRESWQRISTTLPANWRGSRVQIVAVDGETGLAGWLGVSSPLSIDWFTLARSQLSFLTLLPVYTLHFLLFLLPGLALTLACFKGRLLEVDLSLMLVMVFSSLLGYLAFWVYFFDSGIGRWLSWCIIFASLIYVGQHLWRNLKSQSVSQLWRSIWLPTLLMFCVGLLYLAIAYLAEPTLAIAERLTQDPTGWRLLIGGDNILQQLFAEKLYQGADPRQQFFFEWKSSDRPPLQAGIVLLQRPFMLSPRFSYHTIGTVVQCIWIPAIWALCRTMKLPGQSMSWVLAFAISSGFFLYNSVYVWPKLLAGALGVLAITLLLRAALNSQRLSLGQLGVAAVAAALAMLAHGGVVFAFPVALLLLAFPKVFPGWRRLLVATLLFILLLLPWTAYRKLYDPPGSERLTKFHIAGVKDVEDERSASQAIVEEYSRLSPSQILQYKWENAKTLIGLPAIESRWRPKEFFHIFRSLNLLNVGWLVALLALFRPHWRSTPETKGAMALLGMSILSLLVWVGLLFGPGQNIIHFGSYSTFILLFCGLGVFVAQLPKFLPLFLLAIHISIFMVVWIGNNIPSTDAKTLIYTFNFPAMFLVVFLSLLVGYILAKLPKRMSEKY